MGWTCKKQSSTTQAGAHGATFFRGSKPIDGLWISSDVDVSNACVMPFGYGVDDHHAFILNIPIESLVGVDPVKIVRPVSQQLNS
jgi:hypothetical protein